MATDEAWRGVAKPLSRDLPSPMSSAGATRSLDPVAWIVEPRVQRNG
jgi:hypothetical protein